MAKREHGVSTDDRIPRKVYEAKLHELERRAGEDAVLEAGPPDLGPLERAAEQSIGARNEALAVPSAREAWSGTITMTTLF